MAMASSRGSRGGTSRPSRPRRTTPFVAVDVRAHDRGSGGHRLEEHDAERLAAGGRRGVHVRRAEQLGLLGIGHAAEELDALEAAGGHVAACLALLRPGADDEESRARSGLAQDAVGLEQVEQALAWLVATHEQHVRGPVLPARDRDRVGVAGDVDAVGDDLVVAREEAVDEVPRRGTHRDPAVEPRGVAPQRPAAEFVRRREAGVGVERGDVHAARLPEEEQRQERHERLVEVQDVEPLALQQVADLAQVARRERERADRPVRTHREAHPEPDDVALRRSLRAVAGGQDADVVATQAQVLVQEADVLGDPAAFRVDVRADETDLHGWSGPDPASKRGGRARPPG